MGYKRLEGIYCKSIRPDDCVKTKIVNRKGEEIEPNAAGFFWGYWFDEKSQEEMLVCSESFLSWAKRHETLVSILVSMITTLAMTPLIGLLLLRLGLS